ncbi:hypothetical protein [Paenibacillus sp. 2003]|uniref:hypothetical protein n=1 Tax=Paenibacillus sp. 2003 TaxID=2817761 RepID=UPI00285E4ECE|nr:hypothetical protein [Paenibacillus sp. 2003]MDR6720886.1 hypothetical protein [Paenibacillus sp. 2003]
MFQYCEDSKRILQSILGFKLDITDGEEIASLNMLLENISFGDVVNHILIPLDLDTLEFKNSLINSALFALKRSVEREILSFESLGETLEFCNIDERDDQGATDIYDSLVFSSVDDYYEIYGELIQKFLTKKWNSQIDIHSSIEKLFLKQGNKVLKNGSIYKIFADTSIRYKKPLKKIMNPSRLNKIDLQEIKENTKIFLNLINKLEDISVVDEIYDFELDTGASFVFDLYDLFNGMEENNLYSKTQMQTIASVYMIESPELRRIILKSIREEGLGFIETFIIGLMKIRYFIIPLLEDFLRETILIRNFENRGFTGNYRLKSCVNLYIFLSQSHYWDQKSQESINNIKQIISIKNSSLNNRIFSRVPYNLNLVRDRLKTMDGIIINNINTINSNSEDDKNKKYPLDLLISREHDSFLNKVVKIKE